MKIEPAIFLVNNVLLQTKQQRENTLLDACMPVLSPHVTERVSLIKLIKLCFLKLSLLLNSFLSDLSSICVKRLGFVRKSSLLRRMRKLINL